MERKKRIDRIIQVVEECTLVPDPSRACNCEKAIGAELDAERAEERKRVAQAFEAYWWGKDIPGDLRAIGDFIREGGKKHEV